MSDLAAAVDNLDFGGHKGVNVADPGANQDAATKKYHDDHKTSDAAEIVSGVFDDARIPAAIARDIEVAVEIAIHAGLPSAHHTKYTNEEAVAAIEAEPELDLKLFNSATMPRAWVYNTGDQTLTNGTWATLTWTTAEYNVSPGIYPLWESLTNPSRFTCKYPGLYLVHGFVRFNANGTGRRYVTIRKNGSTTLINCETAPTSTSYPTVYCTALVSLADNDYIELRAYQGSGGDLIVYSGGHRTAFMAARLY